MEVLCKYYSNSARLAGTLESLSANKSFRFFCVKGLAEKNKSGFVVHGNVTLVVSWISAENNKTLVALLTTDERYKESDTRTIEFDAERESEVFFTLCSHLRDKYKSTDNPFSIEFEHAEGALSVTADPNTWSLACTLRGVLGDIMMFSDLGVKDALARCTQVKAFKYTTKSAECIREVSVQKSFPEILREVSRYLNRTVVLATTPKSGIYGIFEQYVGPTSALEVVYDSEGSRRYNKVPVSRLAKSKPISMYASTATVEDILKEQGRSLASK